MNPLLPGIYPFWFWNDLLDEQDVRRQIREMAAQGVRGFYIHSRQGLQQPYLSEAFFEMVSVAIEEAEACGLVVNLYDEYPYPSGVAGGEAILGQPQYWATALVQKAIDLEGGSVRFTLPVGQILCCQAFPVVDGQVSWQHPRDLRSSVGMVLVDESYHQGGLTSYNQKRYFASNPTPVLQTQLPSGHWRVFVSVQTVVTRHKYWGQYLDVLNPEAVNKFIELTHDRYANRFGDRFGGSIASIFTDETCPHWSATLPPLFQEKYGYDLLPALTALQDPSHPDHLRVATDLYELRYTRFCEVYDEAIQLWCHAHRIRYAGEKAVLRLAQLSYMDLPGCEPGHTKAGAPLDLLQEGIRGNARAVASAAYWYGKDGSLCECYHSLGWSGTLLDARVIADGLLLMGIDYLVPHGFFYSTHGLKKHDAPPTFFWQMPYWPLFHLLSERIERITKAFAGTHIEPRLLLIDPSSGLPTTTQLKAYESLNQRLMAEHLDFLVVDTDVLQMGTITDGQVHIRDVSAAVVVVPWMQRIEPPLAAWLEMFTHAGGLVVSIETGMDADAAMARILQFVSPSLELHPEHGPGDRVWMVTRAGEAGRCWLLLNTSDEPVTLTLSGQPVLCELPLDNTGTAGIMEGRRTLAPFEAVLLTDRQQQPAEATQIVRMPIPEECTVSPHQDNLVLLNEWQMALPAEDGQWSRLRTVTAMPLANQLAESGLPFAPIIDRFFGAAPELRLPMLDVRYRTSFHHHFNGPVHLLMEPGSLTGQWCILVNGHILTDSDFNTTGMFVNGCLGVDVTDLLQPGENQIVVDVQTNQLDAGLRNPIYLAGEFAVRLHPLALEPRSAQGAFEAYEANGLPYYAGIVDYRGDVTLPQLPPNPSVLIELDVDAAFQEACAVSINDGPFHSMPWLPRRALVPTEQLHVGENRVCIRVYTSLIRAFEGQVFDSKTHAYRDVARYGGANESPGEIQ